MNWELRPKCLGQSGAGVTRVVMSQNPWKENVLGREGHIQCYCEDKEREMPGQLDNVQSSFRAIKERKKEWLVCTG